MGPGANIFTIKRVESEKDLEVFIDDKLNFREHITKKVNIKSNHIARGLNYWSYQHWNTAGNVQT